MADDSGQLSMTPIYRKLKKKPLPDTRERFLEIDRARRQAKEAERLSELERDEELQNRSRQMLYGHPKPKRLPNSEARSIYDAQGRSPRFLL